MVPVIALKERSSSDNKKKLVKESGKSPAEAFQKKTIV
jgi:hypothetical protein